MTHGNSNLFKIIWVTKTTNRIVEISLCYPLKDNGFNYRERRTNCLTVFASRRA